MILSPVNLLFFSVETSWKLGSNVFWKKSYLKVWSLEGTFCLAMSPARKLWFSTFGFQLCTQHQFLGPWPLLKWHSVQGHERRKLSSHNNDIMLELCLANEIVSCCAASHEDKYISNGGDNNARHLLGSNPTQLILQPVARLSFSAGRHHHHQEQAT